MSNRKMYEVINDMSRAKHQLLKTFDHLKFLRDANRHKYLTVYVEYIDDDEEEVRREFHDPLSREAVGKMIELLESDVVGYEELFKYFGEEMQEAECGSWKRD